MKRTILLSIMLFVAWAVSAQEVKVTTLLELNASGGITPDMDGNLYISDFGAFFQFSDSTSVYKYNVKTGELTPFASGFAGASGACFDNDGNFYQSNPHGHSISKISASGEVDHKWATEGMKTPIGLEYIDGSVYVCNCGSSSIGKITDGKYEVFVESDLLKCPNGLTQDDDGNLYACNNNGGDILKITRDGEIEVLATMPVLLGGPNPVGNGHITWKNGWLYVATLGTGQIFRLGLNGEYTHIAGKRNGFSNVDGLGLEATFSKPNAIVASVTGDTLYVNVSEPTWVSNPQALHPASIRMITGVCGLEESNCKE